MSDAPFDPDQPATYARYSGETPQGGKIVLVRYPEGYRLRLNGEVVWRESDIAATPHLTVNVTAEEGDGHTRLLTLAPVRRGQ